MVRPGLLLYGVFPAKETGGLDLRPAMSLYSRVSEVTHHHTGDTISYGRTFTCPHDMRLAVLPGRLCRRAAAQPLRQGRCAAAR